MRTSLLALGLLGCTPGYTMKTAPTWNLDALPIPLSLSLDFTEEEARVLREASRVWSDATDGQIEFFSVLDERTEDPRLPRLSQYRKDEIFGIYRTDKLEALDGLTRWTSHRKEPGSLNKFDIFIDEDNDVPLELLAVHEMGHAIGLGHIDGAPAVMTETFGWLAGFHGLKEADLDALGWLYGTDEDAVGPSGE